MSHFLTWQRLVNNIWGLGRPTSFCQSPGKKQCIHCAWLDLSSAVELLIFLWGAVLSEMSLPVRHQYRLFSAICVYRIYPPYWRSLKGPKSGCPYPGTHLTNLIPDLCWSKNWACFSLHLTSCTLVPIRRKPGNSCSCQDLDLDFWEMLKTCKAMLLLLSLETTWGVRFKESEKLQPKPQAKRSS